MLLTNPLLLPIVATPILLLVQEPPAEELLKVVNEELHKFIVPVIEDGTA